MASHIAKSTSQWHRNRKKNIAIADIKIADKFSTSQSQNSAIAMPLLALPKTPVGRRTSLSAYVILCPHLFGRVIAATQESPLVKTTYAI